MDDDVVEDCTLYNDDSDAETLPDTEALMATDQIMDASNVVDADAINLTEIAMGILDDSTDTTLDAGELSLIINSTVNTKQYEKNKKGIEQRFFDTVEKFGGPLLQLLTRYAQDGYKKERIFYIKLRGDKSEEKRFILNKCLVKVALKWRINRKGKDFGKPYQPSTWATKMKYLFSVFRRKNILFNVQTDFNGEGEFHSVLATQWSILMENDDTFASGIGTSTFDGDADKKLREMYKQGTFDPFSTKTTTEAYDDRKKYMIYVLGRYFLRRGKQEIAFTYWNQVKFKVTECDGERLEYVEVSQQWDKTHKCKLSNTRPRDATQSMPRIYSNANDDLCPHRFLKFFRSVCAPTQERVLCYRASVDALEEYGLKNLPYLYNATNPIGGNPISDVCKKLARELGFEDWEKCTGQGLRKMGITNAMSNGSKMIEKVVLGVSRHKSLQTSMLYQKPTEEMFQNYNRAILGKHVATPPKKTKGKKKNKKQKKEVPFIEEATSEEEAEFEDVSFNYDASFHEDSEVMDTKPPARVSSTNSTTDRSKCAVPSSSVSLALPNSIDAEESVSRAVSSLSGTVVKGSVTSEGNERLPTIIDGQRYNAPVSEEIIPCVVAPTGTVPTTSRYQNPFMNPIYLNHHQQSNNIQRNIFVQPRSLANIEPTTYYWDDRTGNDLMKELEEKRELAQKVKDLEFRLANQKEKYDDMKQDLRDAKERAQKAEWRLMKGKCILM